MRVIIIRHGQTDANKLGREQIIKSSKLIKNIKIDSFYSSDLSSTKETSLIITSLTFHDKEIIFSKSLRERDVGLFEGKLEKDMCLSFKNINSLNYFPKNDESLIDVLKRVSKFYDSIKNKNKTILIVAHRDSIAMLLLYIKDLKITYENYQKMLIDNGSVTLFYDDKITDSLKKAV